MALNTADILFWVLLFTSFGFFIGWVLGDQVCRCRNAEEQVEELRERLEEACSQKQDQDLELKQMRSVLNDTHRLVHAVSKGLEKQPR